MIEFFYWRECPSHERALAMLREAMTEAGIEDSELRVIEVHDGGDSQKHAFAGSPTIRVDGVDIQDPGDQPGGLTCRVYRRRDGRVSPLPDPADIHDALAARGSFGRQSPS